VGKEEIRFIVLHDCQVKNDVNTQLNIVCFKPNSCFNARLVLNRHVLDWRLMTIINVSLRLIKGRVIRMYKRESKFQCTFPGLRSLAGKEDHGIVSVLLLLSLARDNKFIFKFSCLAELLCLAEVRTEGAVTASLMLD